MNTHRHKGKFLTLSAPEKRGRKRRLSNDDMTIVKRELKKRKATPKKVAKKLSESDKFEGTVNEKIIRRNMRAKPGSRDDVENKKKI